MMYSTLLPPFAFSYVCTVHKYTFFIHIIDVREMTDALWYVKCDEPDVPMPGALQHPLASPLVRFTFSPEHNHGVVSCHSRGTSRLGPSRSLATA